MRIVFLVSGNGGNLRFIYEVSEYFNLQVVGVVGDRECGAIQFAKEKGIHTVILNVDRSPISNRMLKEELCKYKADFIVTNIHKIIHEEVLNNVNSKFINLHYSLIPAYQGLIGNAPLNAAMERKNGIHGVTVHVVTKVVDEGETIVQAAFPIYDESNAIQRNFEAGCLALLSALTNKRSKNHECLFFNEIIVNPANDTLDSIFLRTVFDRLKK